MVRLFNAYKAKRTLIPCPHLVLFSFGLGFLRQGLTQCWLTLNLLCKPEMPLNSWPTCLRLAGAGTPDLCQYICFCLLLLLLLNVRYLGIASVFNRETEILWLISASPDDINTEITDEVPSYIMLLHYTTTNSQEGRVHTPVLKSPPTTTTLSNIISCPRNDE